jgi:hypothetical protein
MIHVRLCSGNAVWLVGRPAWSHIGITLMNGHTDQPSELFTQATFTSLLSFAQANHVAWFTFWSFNRDQPCPAGAVEPWAPGTCSNISQNPFDFTKIVAQYAGQPISRVRKCQAQSRLAIQSQENTGINQAA